MLRPGGLTKIRCAIAAPVGVLVAALATALITPAGALASTPRTGTPPAPVTVSGAPIGPGVAPGFVGIATEFWNIAAEVGNDPTKPDTAFEQVARNLSPEGGFSLRIGGDSTDWAWFPIPGIKQPPWVRWTMTPTWTAVTKRLVSDLHAHLIVGLNMEANNPRIAQAELNQIRTGIGSAAPVTFEVGNEPELYSHFPYYHSANGAAVLGRPKTYSLVDMATQWDQMADALPHVRLAGPGYAGLNSLPFVARFLGSTHRLSLLTVHTYPLKSKRCTGRASLPVSDLFAPSSIQGLAQQVSTWANLAHHYSDGIRVDEMNSVTCGGEPGVSNTFGPALWALNILPLYAADGINGVNFQTRPNSPGSPSAQNLIQTKYTAAGWRVVVQPEYYGLLAFAQLTPPGSRILRVSAVKPGLLAWAVRTPRGFTHVVLTNVGSTPATFAVAAAGARGNAVVETLRASGGLGATGGVTLGGQVISSRTGQLTGHQVTAGLRAQKGDYNVTVAPASAAIVTFRG